MSLNPVTFSNWMENMSSNYIFIIRYYFVKLIFELNMAIICLRGRVQKKIWDQQIAVRISS